MENTESFPSQPLVEFLRLGSSIRSAASLTDFGFKAVNETYRLITYRQAFFCLLNNGRLSLEAISGLSSVERNSPFYDWFNQLAKHLATLDSNGQPSQINFSDVSASIQEEWHEWLPSTILIVPLTGRDMKILALLILAREDSFSDEERQTCKALADVYGHALGALKITRPFYSDIRNLAARFKLYYILAAVFIVLFFIPVRQSSLGTAEVTPLIYSSISSSLDGVIAKVLVKPNEQVKKGQPLFRMDDTTIRNRLESAHRTMGVAKSEEFTSRQKAFVDPQSRAELATQEARVKEKSSTIGYMQELLGKMVVTAPENGVILFSDPADLEGRPITTGERVMTLADDNSASMTVWLATSDAVALEPGRRVRLFLHTQPLNPCEGFILSSSYQPVTSPEGIASYRVTAVFADGELRPRLGLRGTAKIYGERVRLGYYLFRRPIAAVRQWLGW